MAAPAAPLFPFIFCLFLLLKVSAADENTTSQTFNTTGFGERNETYYGTESYTTALPVEFEATEPTPSSTEQPIQPTLPPVPLPVSGSLLTPPKVDSVCPCDESREVCDINCCCDRDCGEEAALFTHCSVTSVRGNKQLCSRDVVSYSLGSTTDSYLHPQVSVSKETTYDIFCIQSQNRHDGFSHPSPALPTDGTFDSLFELFNNFMFDLEENGSQVSPVEHQALSGYQLGDGMLTAGEDGDRGLFWLPGPGVTAECVDNNPAAFLKDQSRACFRHLVLDQDCSTSPTLNMNTYTNIQLSAGKNKDAALVPVKVSSVVLQAVDWTQTELSMTEGEDLSPVLLHSHLCANVVLKVGYVVSYSPEGQILNVSGSLVLGFVREVNLPLKQEFQITFVQEMEQTTVHYSGNPGYVVGLPLVSGRRASEVSLLHGAEDQECLLRQHQRSPVLFGLDTVSGCTLRLEDTANCSLVSQLLVDILRGTDSLQYVASFGNSPLNNQLDWVQVKSNFNPGEAQSCSIPLSHHLEVEWTKYGSLANAQPQIVSIKEVIQTNSTSLQWSGGSRILSVRTSVAFIPVSDVALPGYRVTPTINARLPFNFFFPFV